MTTSILGKVTFIFYGYCLRIHVVNKLIASVDADYYVTMQFLYKLFYLQMDNMF